MSMVDSAAKDRDLGPASLAMADFAQLLSRNGDLDDVLTGATRALQAGLGPIEVAIYLREGARLLLAQWTGPLECLPQPSFDPGFLDMELRRGMAYALSGTPLLRTLLFPGAPTVPSGLAVASGDDRLLRVLVLVLGRDTLEGDEAGRVLATAVATLVDVGRRSRVPDAAADSQRLRSILDGLPLSITYIDSEQIYRFANRARRELHREGDIVGRRVADTLSPADYDTARPYMQEALSGHRVAFTASFQVAGSRRIFECTYIPDHSEGGSVQGFFAMLHDCTEQVGAMEQLQASLREKDALLRELHHRIRNNLQLVSSLMDLQAAHAGCDDPQAAFQVTRARVRALTLLHSLIYAGSASSSGKIGNFVAALVRSLSDRTDAPEPASPRIPTLDIEDFPLTFDTATALGLLLNEVLMVVYERGTPTNLTVRLRAAGPGRALFSIESDNVLHAWFDDNGTTEFSQRIVSALIQQLDATIERHDAPRPGLHLTFPV